MITIIDPPSGWKYGFPKPLPKDREEDVLVWLVEQGYPQSKIDELGDYFICRYWEEDENELNLKKLESNLDEALAKETTESLTEWVNSKREKDLMSFTCEDLNCPHCREDIAQMNNDENLADEEYELQQKSFEDSTEMFPYNDAELLKTGFVDGYNKAKETLYTEEQVVGAFMCAYLIGEDSICKHDAYREAKKYIQLIKKQ